MNHAYEVNNIREGRAAKKKKERKKEKKEAGSQSNHVEQSQAPARTVTIGLLCKRINIFAKPLNFGTFLNSVFPSL